MQKREKLLKISVNKASVYMNFTYYNASVSKLEGFGFVALLTSESYLLLLLVVELKRIKCRVMYCWLLQLGNAGVLLFQDRLILTYESLTDVAPFFIY